MNKEEIDINVQRTYWQEKINRQITDVMFYSLEGNELAHQETMEDLKTSIIVLWRFDQRLRTSRVEEKSKRRKKNGVE